MSSFAGATEDIRRIRNGNGGASALDTIKTTFESEAEELLKVSWAALKNANEVVEDAVGSAVKTIQEVFGDEQLLLCLHIDLRCITVFDSRPSTTYNSIDCGTCTTQYIYSKGTVVM